jgi:hypothetical protein
MSTCSGSRRSIATVQGTFFVKGYDRVRDVPGTFHFIAANEVQFRAGDNNIHTHGGMTHSHPHDGPHTHGGIGDRIIVP